ncbi:MAG TPA: ABC-2 transporter permease [Candidatus Cloacimonadota bacterium]|nr:ABC-2 transporter permease [Candidatus Cloacimonadota bacterium]
MLKVIQADLKSIGKQMIIFCLFIIGILIVLSTISKQTDLSFFLLWLPFAGFLILYQTEAKSNFYIILNSFSVSRKDFVVARYALNLVTLLLGIIFLATITLILDLLPFLPDLKLISWTTIILVCFLFMIFTGTFLPIYLKTGSYGMGYFVAAMLPLTGMIFSSIYKIHFEQIPDMIVIVFSCLFYLISFLLSFRFYQQREL